VEDGETIIIDGGTTPYQVALQLREKRIQVVTNSLPVANLFADSRNVELIGTGGILYPGTGVYLGPYAAEMLKNIRAQKAFIGVAGITEEGLYNSNALLVETERNILKAAAEVYVVADHTKLGKRALAYLCGFDSIAGIIMDSAASSSANLGQIIGHSNLKIYDID
jgi:DeoR family transcriptional regulator, fructose operon transcriptional repressor